MSAINIPTPTLIKEAFDATIIKQFADEFLDEAKKWDKPHGAKLPHAELDAFFKNVAPKYDTLDQVETALAVLYKKNNIETTTQGIKQVVSNYKKRVNMVQKESVEQEESKELTASQKRKREAIVKAMKKNIAKFKKKYGSEAKSVLYATATSLAKRD